MYERLPSPCLTSNLYIKTNLFQKKGNFVTNTHFCSKYPLSCFAEEITCYILNTKKRTRNLTLEYEKRNSRLSKSGIVVYFKSNKQFIFLFMCVLNGFSRKNPLFFNLSGFCARIHCLGKFAKDSIALACYCTFWTFLIQRNKSGGSKYSLT